MIDTLKLSKRLTAAIMPPEQAVALADGLAEAITGSTATKGDVAELRGDIKAVEAKVTMLMSQVVGINVAATIAVLIKHW